MHLLWGQISYFSFDTSFWCLLISWVRLFSDLKTILSIKSVDTNPSWSFDSSKSISQEQVIPLLSRPENVGKQNITSQNNKIYHINYLRVESEIRRHNPFHIHNNFIPTSYHENKQLFMNHENKQVFMKHETNYLGFWNWKFKFNYKI